MSFLSNRSRILVLLLACVATIAAYWPGLHGTFFFDDNGALLLNEGLKPADLGFHELARAAWSYAQSGPLGRPIAMLTFALGDYFHGQNAFLYKLENLLIHVVNGVLIFYLLQILFGIASAEAPTAASPRALDRATNLALFATAWWLLNPMGMTAVLYVVQRMTSLAALFSLAGLLGYTVLRRRSIMSPGKFPLRLFALAVLAVATALSMYTKETGALTLAFAWCIEFFLLTTLPAPKATERNWRRAVNALPWLAIMGAALYLARHPDWLFVEVPNRGFTPFERLLTEFRVVGLYVQQILVPVIGRFGLYHTIALSHDFLTPATTLYSALLHGALISGAFLLRRRLPVFGFGITWFYAGHVLESTVFPLELIHEHRNYLPMLGLLVAVSELAYRALANIPRLRPALALLIPLVFGFVTITRADAMGSGLKYFLFEANRHPESARATFDAGNVLSHLALANPKLRDELAPQALAYFKQSAAADPDAIPPLFGKLKLSVMLNQPSEAAQDVQVLEGRLRNAVPANGWYMIFMSIMELVATDSPYFTADDAERLFKAALANPRLQRMNRASIEGNYALLVLGSRHDKDMARHLFESSLKAVPHASQIRTLYAGLLIDNKEYAEANRQLSIAQDMDEFGYYAQTIAKLREEIVRRQGVSSQ